jgi:ribonuclease HI
MSKAAYLIWRIRNKCIIDRDGKPATEQEIINRWYYHINYRLKVDVTLATCPPEGGKPAMAPKKVLGTWPGTLDNEGAMPVNWLRDPRVLMGGRVTQRTQPIVGVR